MFSYSGNSCSRDYFSISLGDITQESLICNQRDNAAILEVKAKQFFL